MKTIAQILIYILIHVILTQLELVTLITEFIKEQMAKKKAFALRVNEDMLKAIEKWASDEFRSTNGQIEWMLMESLKKANRNPKKS